MGHSLTQSSLWSNWSIHTGLLGKNIVLTIWSFVNKLMLLLLICHLGLSQLPSKGECLLISWLQSWSTVTLEPKKIKSVTASTFCPSTYLSWSDGTACHDLGFFLMLSFKSAFSLSPFTLIKRLISSSSLSAVRVVTSAYLRVLLFLSAILIPACDSSSTTFHMMYSEHKLNKQNDNIQPCHTPFPILNQSVVPCKVLIVASWPAHRFLRRLVRWFCTSISLRIFRSLLRSTQSKASTKSVKQK